MTRPQLKTPLHWVACGGGAGLLPKAPGTFGTLVAVPLYYLLHFLPRNVYAVFVLLAFVVGVWICDRAVKDFGVDDDPAIVWDEIVGYWLTMLFVYRVGWMWMLVGFILFRVLDIWKPWPISWLDRHVKGGLGVMLDDIVAAIGAGLLLWGGAFLFG